MKKFLILLLALSSVMLYGIRNWKTHTNTTHLFDLYEHDGIIYMATWGGFVLFDMETNQFVKTFTNVDGLTSQDFRALAGFEETGEIMAGTNAGGLERYIDGKFDIPLSSTTGLTSEKVQDVETFGDQIFIATNAGMSVFSNSQDFPMPLFINDFTNLNGLSSVDVQEIEITQDGYIVCGNAIGIDYCHIDSMMVVSSWHNASFSELGIPEVSMSDLSINGNTLAISTSDGLAVLRDFPASLDMEHYSTDNGLESNLVYPVYVDRDNNIWFSYGTWDSTNLLLENSLSTAVTMLDPDEGFTTWNNSVVSDKIMGFTTVANEIAACSWGDGFYLLEDNEWIQHQPQSIIANTVTQMAVDHDGLVWIVNGYRGGATTSRGTRGVSGYDVKNDVWYNYNVDNSPLLSNNMFCVGVDKNNRKCFGTWYSSVPGWDEGISIYDEIEGDPTWSTLTSGLLNRTISFIIPDPGYSDSYDANLWIGSYGTNGGINVLDNEGNITNFYVPWFDLKDPITAFIGKDKKMFGSYHDGLRIYEGDGIPSGEDTSGWSRPEFSELENSGRIYAITYRENDWESEYWVASSNGLFVMDEFDNWFKLGTSIKREKWDKLENEWVVYQRYFTNEQRLFGAVTTIPTALFTDPFDRVWIGTEQNGITVYDGETDTYTTYNTSNAPLLSNYITDFAYEPISGRLYIGTPEGLNSVEIGISENPETVVYDKSIKAFPNPYYPDQTSVSLMIVNGITGSGSSADYGLFPDKTKCNIYDLTGRQILTLHLTPFKDFRWDGTNEAGRECSSGNYFYVIYNDEGQISKGTIALIR